MQESDRRLQQRISDADVERFWRDGAIVLRSVFDQPWLGNVSELIEVLGEYCGVVDEGTPRRWSGDEGRATAQEEFLRQELEEAFEEVKALLREDECEGTEWILPHPRREFDDPEGDPDE